MAKKTYPHPHARSMADRMECIREAISKASTIFVNIQEFSLPALPGRISETIDKQIKDALNSLELASRAMLGEDEERTTP